MKSIITHLKPQMTKTKYKAGVVAYRKNGKGETEILLVSARKYKNSWVFPVGTVEKNETDEEAAIRECREESGYIVELEEKVGVYTTKKPNKETIFTYFSAHVAGQTDNYEKDRTRTWVKLDNLSEKVYDFLLEVVEDFKKGLGHH